MTERTKDVEGTKVKHPTRATVSPQDVLRKMREFGKRREKFIAAVRKSKG